MTPQTNLNGTDRMAEVPFPTTPTSVARQVETPMPGPLTDAERQRLAMSWVGITLGAILPLGALALWAAEVFGAGFLGWLLGMALLGLVMVAVVIVLDSALLRPHR
jgi:hypothetical protein